MLQKCKLKQVCGMYYYLFIKLLNNKIINPFLDESVGMCDLKYCF